MYKIRCNPRETGFTLIELMIAMLISVIMTFVVLKMLAYFEHNNRITTTSISAHQNGQIAVYMLDQELRLAGYGLSADELQDCANYYSYYDDLGGNASSPIANFSTIAVTIIDGGAGSDQLVTRYGDSLRIHEPVALDAAFSKTDDSVSVDTVFGFNAAELILIVDDSNNCTIRQITAVDTGSTNLTAIVGTTPYNAPNSLINNESWPDYAINDRVYPLGNLVVRNYAVSGSTLTVQDMDEASATDLVDNIVDLQAQYGISATADSNIVTEWVDATGGTWATPTVANSKRIKAIRLAVVTSSSKNERGNVSPATIKMWPDVSGSGQNTTGPTYTVPDRSYRYKVLQTIVPLRNLLN